MAENKPLSRLTESIPGRVAGWLLAVLWIFSMSGVDCHAFSSYPVCIALSAVLLLVLAGMLAGLRLVRMSLTGWFSLMAGGYFLVRCLNSYSVVDSWCETVLILGAFVYYVAGIYCAQNQSYRGIVAVLAAALVLNLLAFWAAPQPWFELSWTGRAAQTPAGANTVPTTLFVYKNFAGVFMCVAGCALGLWAAWKSHGVARVLLLLLSACSVICSFACGTRASYLTLFLCIVGIWLFSLLKALLANRRLGVGIVGFGFILFVALVVALYDFFFGHHLVASFSDVNSHLRYLIWSSVFEILPRVPEWGFGANATQWEIVPFYDEWHLPNYAHNEYLQLWVDYGPVGVSLACVLLLLHVVQGGRCVASEEAGENRRMAASMAMLILVPVAVYALVDFPWHSFAFLSMCSFACGVLASPFRYAQGSLFSSRKWAAGCRPPVVGIRAQHWPGRVLLIGGAVLLLLLSSRFVLVLRPAWHAQWEYNELCAPGRDADGNQRRALIAGLMPRYPSPALADTYFMLPPCAGDLQRRERLLKQALSANPKQLFTVVMLVDVLGEQGKCREAEMLMRQMYEGDGMKCACLANWPAYYAFNLLRWGREEMRKGNHGVALSMFEYALKMNEKSRISFSVTYRKGPQPWKEYGGIKPGLPALLQTTRRDVSMLRMIGARPDDSWQQPMEPGGKPALYCSLVRQAR